jgi:hypothetical protein
VIGSKTLTETLLITKRINENNIMKKKIITIDLEKVQELSISKIGRKMDEVELKRLHHLIQYDPAFWVKLNELLEETIEEATDEIEGDWSGYDCGHRKYSLEKLYRWSTDNEEKSAIENFQENIMQSFGKLYSQQLSEATKRGIKAKKEREKNSFEKGFDM